MTGSVAPGDFSISFELTDSLRVRAVFFAGKVAAQVPEAARRRIAATLEGAAFDEEVLRTVLRRAFQASEVALPGVGPDDVVRAMLEARERNG